MVVGFVTKSVSSVSPLTLWPRILVRQGVLDKVLCDKVCQWLATGQWFSSGTLGSSTNKTDHHDITVILLKVVLNTKTITLNQIRLLPCIETIQISKNTMVYYDEMTVDFTGPWITSLTYTSFVYQFNLIFLSGE